MQQKEIGHLNKKHFHENLFIKLLAHIISILVCIFFAFFLFGTGMPDFMKIDITHITLFNFLLALPMLGYIITWFRESIGSVVLFLGGIGLMMYHSFYGDIDMAAIFGLPFIACALLFYWHMENKRITRYK